MELYVLTGFVVLLAVIMAIIVIKLIGMVREGRPLLAIGSLAVPLPGATQPAPVTATARPARMAPAAPTADPQLEQSGRRDLGLFRRSAPVAAWTADMPIEDAPESTRRRRILTVSEYEQAVAEPSPELPSALPVALEPETTTDCVQRVEAAIGAALDRYVDGAASLDDFIAVLVQLDAEVQARTIACGAVSLPDDLRCAKETIAWSLDWARQQQAN